MPRIEKNLDQDFIDGSVCTTTPPQPITIIRTHVEGYGNVELTSCHAVSCKGECSTTGDKCTRTFVTPYHCVLIQQYTKGEWPENQQVIC